MGSANFRKIAGEFLSEFRWQIFSANFPAQNCRHSSPVSLSRTQTFSRRFSAFGGDQHSRWGAASENKSIKPWACIFTLPPCRTDAAWQTFNSWLAGAPTIENRVEQKLQNTNATLVATICVIGANTWMLDERQITHLICVRLRHLLYDFFSGVFRAF